MQNPSTPPPAVVNDSLSSHNTGLLKKYIGKGLRYVLPVGVSAGLVVWLFHKVNFRDVMATIHEGVDFYWIAVMMLLTALSHMIRGVRWGMQLRAAGVRRMPVVMEWVSIWGAYALNLLFPQLGEAWRCVFVSRREDAPLSTVIGTDIGDRGSDLVMILILIAVALGVAHPELMDFMHKYSFGRRLDAVGSSVWLWVGLAGVVGACWVAFHFFRQYKLIREAEMNLKRMWAGFKVIFFMKKWWLYVILTIGIWTCYFLETYVCFLAFPFTRHLMSDPGNAMGLLPGLVVFVFGSCSMAIPSNGGLGPWNLAVMFALTLFGVSATQGTAYSLVVWSFQTVTYICLGIFCAAYISVTDRHDKEHVRRAGKASDAKK